MPLVAINLPLPSANTLCMNSQGSSAADRTLEWSWVSSATSFWDFDHRLSSQLAP